MKDSIYQLNDIFKCWYPNKNIVNYHNIDTVWNILVLYCFTFLVIVMIFGISIQYDKIFIYPLFTTIFILFLCFLSALGIFYYRLNPYAKAQLSDKGIKVNPSFWWNWRKDLPVYNYVELRNLMVEKGLISFTTSMSNITIFDDGINYFLKKNNSSFTFISKLMDKLQSISLVVLGWIIAKVGYDWKYKNIILISVLVITTLLIIQFIYEHENYVNSKYSKNEKQIKLDALLNLKWNEIKDLENLNK